MKRSFLGKSLVFLTLLAATTIQADTLVLRDGRRIEGQLVSVRNGVVEFEEVRPFGQARALRFDRYEVGGIQFDRIDGNSPRDPQPTSTFGGRPSGLRERQVTVTANVQWTDTNVDVRPGQEVYFEARGEVRWGPSRRDGPGGESNSPMNPNRPIPNRPGAALIGRVGENSTDYFFIGVDRGPIRMRSPGRLFLGINDDQLQDNSGAFRVVVSY
jgi:hypothetical protein